MTDWKEFRLGDIFDIINGYAFKSCDFVNNGVPVIKIKNVKPNVINFNDLSFVSTDFIKVKASYLIRPTDILITMSGNRIDGSSDSWVGKVSLFKHKGDYFLNQRVSVLRLKNDVNFDITFLSYLLSSWDAQLYFIKHANSSGGQANISPSIISNYFFSLPPLAEQRRIAGILSALDEKIETNRRINARLEELAQAIFKSWFIDFAPFGGQMPEDWKMGTLSDIIIVKYGKDHKKLQDGNVPVYGSGGIMRFVDKSLYSKESVLIPRKGTLNNIIYVDEPFWSVDTMFYSEMKYENIAKYIFFVLSRLNFKSMNSGSAIPSMTTNILNALPIVIPNSSVLERFEKNISPIFSKIKSLSKESARLAEMRDALLPRLMSGEYSEIFENSEYFEGSENSEGYEGFV